MDTTIIYVIIGAVIGGIVGGVKASKSKKNLWTGKPIAKGRNAFSLKNTPK
jgi:hypothetical protein